MDINRSKIYEPVKESGKNGSKVIQTSQLFRESREQNLTGSEKFTIKNIICFSHLRWNFVFQRPQHLLTRWARECRVFYFEEPIRGNFDTDFLRTVYSNSGLNLTIITPYINDSRDSREINRFLTQSLKDIIKWYQIENYLLWYLTPMAVEFAADLDPEITVYDSMDELSCFKGAHPNMIPNENILLELADVVFTGGYNLYEYKKNRHNNIHPFPSSIDQKHFESGIGNPDPHDQSSIQHPRVGFFGVIDERLDIDLLSELAIRMPDVQFIMIGPVVKIDPEILPKHKNIHYLGQKKYGELPSYLANWDVAILPFAKNDSTRFISPTKTPEYLSAGRPVVSTSIRDVVVPYGEMGLVEIADNCVDFADAIRRLLNMKDKAGWSARVREHLKSNSWDLTWARMREVIYKTLDQKKMGLVSAFNTFSSGSAK
jgi:UDP-galactopyranose mutase